MGCEEPQGVVTPVVLEAAADDLRLAREGVDRQQLDRGDSEADEVLDGHRVRQPGIRAPQCLGDSRQLLGEVAHVDLVDERLAEGAVQWRVLLPVEVLVDDDTPRGVGRGVAVVPQPDVAGELDPDLVAEHLRPPAHPALDGAGVGVHQELRPVVPEPGLGAPRTGRTHGIPLTGTHPGEVAEPVAVGPLGERDPPLGGSDGVARIEEADLDGVGVPAVDTHLRATVDERHPGRRREVPEGTWGWRGAHGPKRRGRIRWVHE